jgi:hypothetical protein
LFLSHLKNRTCTMDEEEMLTTATIAAGMPLEDTGSNHDDLYILI